MLEYLLCFVTGLLAKLTDWQVDEKLFIRKNLQFVTGALYGLGAGFLATRSTPLATLILAITLGVLFSGKIDKRAHQYAIAFFLGAIAVFGLPAVNLWVLAALLAFAFADEALNDFAEGKRLPVLSFIGRRRLLLDAGALAVSLATGEWAYFLALACFDAGYQLVDWLAPRFLRTLPGMRGHHLLLDLYDCSVKRLDDATVVDAVLKGLPARVGLKPISKPIVKRYESGVDEGLTGFVLLAESHCSVHTYPRFGTAHLDVFSCKPFESEEIAKWLKKKFKAKKAIERMVVRSED